MFVVISVHLREVHPAGEVVELSGRPRAARRVGYGDAADEVHTAHPPAAVERVVPRHRDGQALRVSEPSRQPAAVLLTALNRAESSAWLRYLEDWRNRQIVVHKLAESRDAHCEIGLLATGGAQGQRADVPRARQEAAGDGPAPGGEHSVLIRAVEDPPQSAQSAAPARPLQVVAAAVDGAVARAVRAEQGPLRAAAGAE